MLKISTFQVGKLIFIKNVWIFCGTYECYNLVRFNEIEKIYNNRPDQKKRIN